MLKVNTKKEFTFKGQPIYAFSKVGHILKEDNTIDIKEAIKSIDKVIELDYYGNPRLVCKLAEAELTEGDKGIFAAYGVNKKGLVFCALVYRPTVDGGYYCIAMGDDIGIHEECYKE